MKLTIFTLFLSFSAIAQNCSFIKTTIDKFDGTITMRSPIDNPCLFIKHIRNGDTTLIFRPTASGSTLNTNIKGVIILFKDGTKIERPNEIINVNSATGTGWEYSAYMHLTKEEEAQFLISPMTDYRLYIYDATVTNYAGKIYQKILNCIKDK